MINIHESVIKIKNKDKLFFGNLPFSDTFGLPFLINRVLTSLLSYSNGIQRIAKEPATKISRVNREHFEFSSKPIHASYPANKFKYTNKNLMYANYKPAFMQQSMHSYDYFNYSNPAQHSNSNPKKNKHE